MVQPQALTGSSQGPNHDQPQTVTAADVQPRHAQIAAVVGSMPGIASKHPVAPAATRAAANCSSRSK